MKAICYLQLVARHYRSGAISGLSIKHLSQRHPGVPMDGARLVKLELEVPDDAFKATQVKVNIPIEKLAANVTAEVK